MGPASRRSRAPRGEGDRLREEIVTAADALLRERGNADDVSMRAVAKRVGCTPTAIYLHFADRTDLIFEVCRRHFETLDRSLARAVRGVSDPVEEMRALGKAYVRFGLRRPEAYRIIFMGHPSMAPPDMDVDELLAIGGFPRVVDAAARCMDAEAIGRDDPFAVATRLWVVVHGVTSAMISKPWFPWGDRDALVETLLDTQLSGLRP